MATLTDATAAKVQVSLQAVHGEALAAGARVDTLDYLTRCAQSLFQMDARLWEGCDFKAEDGAALMEESQRYHQMLENMGELKQALAEANPGG